MRAFLNQKRLIFIFIFIFILSITMYLSNNIHSMEYVSIFDSNLVEQEELIKKIAEQYNAELDVKDISQQEADEFLQKVFEGEVTNSIFNLRSDMDFGPLVNFNMLLPIGDILEDNYYKELPSILQPIEEVVTHQNQIYGLPTPITYGSNFPFDYGTVILWNKDLFNEIGLPDLYNLQNNNQWTWDELLEFGQIMNSSDDYWLLGGLINFPSRLPDFFLSYGAPIISLEATPELALNTDLSMGFLEKLYKVFNEKEFVYDAERYSEHRQAFINGEIAMFTANLYEYEVIKKELENEFDLGLAYLPRGSKKENNLLPVNRVIVTVFPATASAPDLMVNIYKEFFDEWLPEDIEDNLIRRVETVFNDNQGKNLYLEMTKNWQVVNGIERMLYISAKIDNYLAKLINGELTPQETIDEMEPTVQEIIDSVVEQLFIQTY